MWADAPYRVQKKKLDQNLATFNLLNIQGAPTEIRFRKKYRYKEPVPRSQSSAKSEKQQRLEKFERAEKSRAQSAARSPRLRPFAALRNGHNQFQSVNGPKQTEKLNELPQMCECFSPKQIENELTKSQRLLSEAVAEIDLIQQCAAKDDDEIDVDVLCQNFQSPVLQTKLDIIKQEVQNEMELKISTRENIAEKADQIAILEELSSKCFADVAIPSPLINKQQIQVEIQTQQAPFYTNSIGQNINEQNIAEDSPNHQINESIKLELQPHKPKFIRKNLRNAINSAENLQKISAEINNLINKISDDEQKQVEIEAIKQQEERQKEYENTVQNYCENMLNDLMDHELEKSDHTTDCKTINCLSPQPNTRYSLSAKLSVVQPSIDIKLSRYVRPTKFTTNIQQLSRYSTQQPAQPSSVLVIIPRSLNATFNALSDCAKSLQITIDNSVEQLSRQPLQDVVWQYKQTVQLKQLTLLNESQWINHFPGVSSVTNKLQLHRHSMQSPSPLLPQTFALPGQFSELCKDYQLHRSIFIVKPSNLSRGRQISLARTPIDIRYERPSLAQKYITNPLLYQGRKCDFRCYVLVIGGALRYYLYLEGICRISPNLFDLGDERLETHLTNTSISKQFNHSSRRLMTESLQCFEPEIQKYLIGNIMRCAGLAVKLLTQVQSGTDAQPFVNSAKCFELLGIDVMVTADNRPYLIEVNASPSLACDCPLDFGLKPRLIADVIEAVGGVVGTRWMEGEL